MNLLNLAWWNTSKNWGDAINPVICNHISGRDINHVSSKDKNKINRYYCIGSILDHPSSENFEVWGSGFISKKSKLKFKPNKIHAVRGPLTRELLLKQGFECPEIYGDPALLYPTFYKPKVDKEFKIGIIPHYVDKQHPWVQKFQNDPEVNIIDILANNHNDFVDELNKCEIILSSSLHGIICGDSYGIPSYWIELSNKVIGKGFKFRDYFASVGRDNIKPLKLKKRDLIPDISSQFDSYKIDIDTNSLYESCPFKK